LLCFLCVYFVIFIAVLRLDMTFQSDLFQLCVFQPPPCKSGDEDAPLPFQNRNNEISQLATDIVSNFSQLVNRPRTLGAQSQYRLVLATTAQMFGSGKSSLGVNFLSELKKSRFNTCREKLAKDYSKKAVDTLLKLVYVGVDFRMSNQALQLVNRVRIALLLALLSVCPSEKCEAAINRFNEKPISSFTCSQIIGCFEKMLECRFFVHFDEIDRLFELESRLSTRIELLYRFWEEINGIHNRKEGSALFCSGRSPLLYLMGKGRFSQVSSPDNSTASCILLDSLKQKHIEAKFEEAKTTGESKKRNLYFLVIHQTL